MLKIYVLCFSMVVGLAQHLPMPPPVLCGEIPDSIHKCLSIPKIVTTEISAQCGKLNSECESLSCIFNKSGWMNGSQVDRQKVAGHMDTFARDHPAWGSVMELVKTSCLAQDLQTQGIYLNCPAYDIFHCTLTILFKNAPDSQWSRSRECEPARQFARSCPVCPEGCFAPRVPSGSCNACRLLPRTP